MRLAYKMKSSKAWESLNNSRIVILSTRQVSRSVFKETKLEALRMERVKQRMKYEGRFVVNALGRRGGLALICKTD